MSRLRARLCWTGLGWLLQMQIVAALNNLSWGESPHLSWLHFRWLHLRWLLTALQVSGECTSGDCTLGDCTSADCTSADCTLADWNSGDCTSGDCTSADCTWGDCTSVSSVLGEDKHWQPIMTLFWRIFHHFVLPQNYLFNNILNNN